MKRRLLCSLLASIGLLVAPKVASAAPRWVDRSITLPPLVFAGDIGIGIGHDRFDTPRDLTGPGLNLEAGFGITRSLELGFRTGIRFGDDARAVQADSYGRTLWTETYGTNHSQVANPELRLRWSAYDGEVVEVGLEGRVFLPMEDNSHLGMMFGVPLAFHAGRILRIDTGAYIPVVFQDPSLTAFSVPGYFWFQATPKLWLGPMTALRWVDPGAGNSHTDFLLGFGLGVQVASAVDLKTMIFFPRINAEEGARTFGAGFGVQFRINE